MRAALLDTVVDFLYVEQGYSNSKVLIIDESTKDVRKVKPPKNSMLLKNWILIP